jgi:cell division septum initiation protein DivIVA
MNILVAIRREERKLEKKVSKLQRELDGLTGAARVLGNSTAVRLDNAQKRVMSAAARAKISAAAKRRWAKVKAGAKKAVS